VKRSAEFYLQILGGNIVREGEPTIIQIANSWIILNVGGGPTDDKPIVTLRTPQNPNETGNFMNIRVAPIISMTYKVTILNSTKPLSSHNFDDSDGILDLELVPTHKLSMSSAKTSFNNVTSRV
jgi:hypothetical protein